MMGVTKLPIKKSFLMNSIDFERLIITVFVLVDDWYQAQRASPHVGKTLKPLSPGAKPEMSDSEIMTLALLMDYLPFPGETQFIGAAPGAQIVVFDDWRAIALASS
ncbi:MAG: hypothetical protein AAF652_01515 [Cyanobacteria bacterium P01_C01_bin.72]